MTLLCLHHHVTLMVLLLPDNASTDDEKMLPPLMMVIMSLSRSFCSIMFQNCSNCRIICACMQLRCRDCTDLSFSLYSTTNPSIESCHGLQFSCLTLSYQQLEGLDLAIELTSYFIRNEILFCYPFLNPTTDQFESAGLCVFNNNWYQIYDFNAFEGDESHWSLIPSLADLDQSLSELEVSKSLEMTADAQRSAVPFTLGIKSSRDFSCLIVLFSDGEEKKRARTLINTLTFLTVSLSDSLIFHAFLLV